MPAWAGWETQFLKAANLPTGTKNQAFLNDWQLHSTSNCANNPIDLSVKVGASTNCFNLPGTAGNAQRYTTHAQAATAFNRQLHDGTYAALLAALNSGAPYEVSNPAAVEKDLVQWGSGIFELEYKNQVTTPPSGGGGGGGLNAPRAHKGWADMRRSVNHHWPEALADSDRHIRAALRSIGKARKVRL